jgi:hypothetical protein
MSTKVNYIGTVLHCTVQYSGLIYQRLPKEEMVNILYFNALYCQIKFRTDLYCTLLYCMH